MSETESTKILSDCEEMIMTVIWDNEEDLTLYELMALMEKRYNKVWKAQTVATFVKRMEKKGYISIYRIGRYSHYHAEYSQDKFKLEVIEEIKNRLFNGNAADMYSFIRENWNVSEVEKEKME